MSGQRAGPGASVRAAPCRVAARYLAIAAPCRAGTGAPTWHRRHREDREEVANCGGFLSHGKPRSSEMIGKTKDSNILGNSRCGAPSETISGVCGLLEDSDILWNNFQGVRARELLIFGG